MDRNQIDRSQLWVDWVALRKESVDRNRLYAPLTVCARSSLSARRAWIEIKKNPLRKKLLTRRSPQGERG